MLIDSKSTTIQVYDDPGRMELKSQFIDLRAKGYSYQKIARRLKVSKSTLANWSTELEGEIASLRAMELEALYERYFLTKESRIKLLGEQLKAIQTEIKSRSLKDISTEKLLDLQLKLYQALQEEYVEVRPLSDQEIEVLDG
jgi:transposase